MRARLALLLCALLTVSLSAGIVVATGVAASAATPLASTYTAIRPARVVDTRSGKDGNHKGAVRGGHGISPKVAGLGGVPASGVTAVAVTITALSSTASGGVSAYAYGTPRPGATNLQFTKGKAASDLAIVPVRSGRINLFDTASSGTVQLVVDVSGYYRSATTTPGAYYPLAAASRVVDTRTGRDGNHKGAVGHSSGISPLIGGHGGVPTTGVSAVAVTITVVGPTKSGSVLAYQYGGARPSVAMLHFLAGHAASAFAIVPVSSGGRLTLINTSAGSLQFVVDVAGYFRAGVPTVAKTFQALQPARILSNRLVGRSTTVTVPVAGKAGVPRTGVSAVEVSLTVSSPAKASGLEAWGSGGPPGVANVQYAAGQFVAGLALVPVSAGAIHVRNYSTGSLRLNIDIDGYVASTTLTAPKYSISRYVRSLSQTKAGFADTSTTGQGCVDARAGSTLVLLDIGAQLNKGTGVSLTGVNIPVMYGALVTAVNDYLKSFAACKTKSVTVAVGTNNGANNWTAYSAVARGTDWANKVVDMIKAPTGSSGITIAGADDIEASFFSTEAQAKAWETAYLKATPRGLIFNGSADGCPKTYRSTAATCEFGWTEKQYYALAHSGTRIKALPQIYYAYQAVQWANIDAIGGRGITFAGSLTEYVAACGADCAMTPAVGWAALRRALSTVVTSPSLPADTDLRISR